MAFEDIEKGKWAGKTRVFDRVKICLGQHTATISISGDIITKLGNPTHVKIGVGSREHRGMFLIRGAGMKTENTYKLSGGSITGKRSPGTKTITISHKKLGLKKSDKKINLVLSHQATDDGLVVKAPDDLLY